MSQRKNQELFTEHQVKVWLIDCAALQADTLTDKNVIGGIHLRNRFGAASVYNAIRILMTTFTRRPRDV